MSRGDGHLMSREMIMEIVENQMRDENPPETRQTYDRLTAMGYSDEDAKQLIARVVVIELFGMLKNTESFNTERFVEGLNKLPEVPAEL